MKFLVALSVMLSASAFAQGAPPDNKIRCYEPPRQNQTSQVVLVLEQVGNTLKVVEPEEHKGNLILDNGCLIPEPTVPTRPTKPSLHDVNEIAKVQKLCPTQGQEIRKLTPIDMTLQNLPVSTVYCDKRILPFFNLPI